VSRNAEMNRDDADDVVGTSTTLTPSAAVLKWRRSLRVGDHVDVRDKTKVWYECVVKSVGTKRAHRYKDDSSDSKKHVAKSPQLENDDADHPEDEIQVHYMGWGAKYDEWISRYSERVKPLHEETGNWRTMLRLDDVIEVLCVHQEGDEVKRRWFRGLVMKIDKKKQKLLVIYDKRGVHDQRWIDLFGEEICKAGTHVPPSNTSYEIVPSFRKEYLMAIYVHCDILNLLRSNHTNMDIVRSCLEGLAYLVSGEDRLNRVRLLASAEPEPFLCHLLNTYCDFPELMPFFIQIMDSFSCVLDLEVLLVGDLVESQWRGRGTAVYPGMITRVHSENKDTYEVTYDDGDCDVSLPIDRIRLRTSGRTSRPANDCVQRFLSWNALPVLMRLCDRYHEDNKTLYPLIFAVTVLAQASLIQAASPALNPHSPTNNLEASENASWAIHSTAERVTQFMLNRGYVYLTTILQLKISELKGERNIVPSSLIFRGFGLLCHLASLNKSNKSILFERQCYIMAISVLIHCTSYPRLLSVALKYLYILISKDQTFAVPECRVPVRSSLGYSAINLDQDLDLDLDLDNTGDRRQENAVVLRKENLRDPTSYYMALQGRLAEGQPYVLEFEVPDDNR